MKENFEVMEVKKALQKYIDGTYKADVELLKSVFHKNAVMNGYLGENLVSGDPTPFYNDLLSRPSMEKAKDPFKADIRSLTVLGNTADAVVLETGFFGKVTIEDHFHLLKTDGEWKIVSKLFSTIG